MDKCSFSQLYLTQLVWLQYVYSAINNKMPFHFIVFVEEIKPICIKHVLIINIQRVDRHQI